MHLELMRDKSKTMPNAPNPGDVRTLRIWHCSYRTLDPIYAFRNLRTLVIATFPDATLAALASLSQLQYLQIIHMPRITDLSPLAALSNLQCLSLETLPNWDPSGKVTEVESLDPISELRQLRHLALFGVRPKNRSLSAIERCPRLQSARFSKYPESEVARFYEATQISNAHVPEPEFDTS
jgi:hypothetical protein